MSNSMTLILVSAAVAAAMAFVGGYILYRLEQHLDRNRRQTARNRMLTLLNASSVDTRLPDLTRVAGAIVNREVSAKTNAGMQITVVHA